MSVYRDCLVRLEERAIKHDLSAGMMMIEMRKFDLLVLPSKTKPRMKSATTSCNVNKRRRTRVYTSVPHICVCVEREDNDGSIVE